MLDRPSFILRASVQCKERLKGNFCKICVLLKHLFFKVDSFGLEFKGLVHFSHDVSLWAFEAIYDSTCYLLKKKKNAKSHH